MFAKHFLAILLSGSLVLATAPAGFADQTSQPTNQSTPTNAKQTPEQVQQLVAPIALYPDELVAEVLAAATYPDQVVEADRWLQENKSLQGKQLADAVNKQPWDSSVKALTEFPSVLANMDKNLSWTSSLGGAYMNQQQDVMDAVQVMRQRAETAGNLKNNSQQKVKKQGKTIIIEPADTQVVYVPTYDPWLVYGAPLGVWPGWYAYPGLYVATPGISFGFGFGVGFFGGYGWGWHHWGFDWGHRTVVFNHNTYISHSRTFINRTNVSRGRTAVGGHGFAGSTRSAGTHGFAGSHAALGHSQRGSSSRAFGGTNRAAAAGSRSFGGHSSFGGFHGGGGSHGGGGRR
jgi:Protein of unknown function (DUF3300)